MQSCRVAEERDESVLSFCNSATLQLCLLAFATLPASAQTLQYRSPGGTAYYSQRDTGAVAHAESALAANPRDVDLLIALGVAQSGARQYREAIGTFTRGLRIAPDNALLYRWRGHRNLSVRDFTAAMRDLERGARLDSTLYGIWYHLGVVRFVRGDFPGAADAFTRAQRIPPDANEWTGATDWLWMSLMRAGRRAEAAAALTRLPDTLHVTSAAAYARRIMLYKGLIGPTDVVQPADTEGIQVATLSFGVGNWYLLRGDTAHAREYFGRAVATDGWPAFGFIASEAELRRLR